MKFFWKFDLPIDNAQINNEKSIKRLREYFITNQWIFVISTDITKLYIYKWWVKTLFYAMTLTNQHKWGTI